MKRTRSDHDVTTTAGPQGTTYVQLMSTSSPFSKAELILPALKCITHNVRLTFSKVTPALAALTID